MALNFCSPHLHPRIYSDKVSVDGHEITNLISENYFVKNKGFLAERFIKPPVQITVAFPCNVDIEKIVVDPIVGSQKSCGFEIMTRSDPVKDSWIVNERVPFEKSPHAQGMYVSVGRCFRDYSGHVLFVFANRSYQSKSSFSRSTSHEYTGANIINYEMRHFRSISLGSVSHVLIRITRTQGGCIPCIKSIAIFGQPAHSVPKPILNELYRLNNQFHQDLRTEIVATPKKKSESNENLKKSEPEEEIPKEFMDPITCDVMTIPLLLPSGHSIDKTTLERHVAEEAKWGRSPNDPFTGVTFHGSSKPVPNSSLKVRIDQFLVKSGIKFKSVARTVGRSSDVLNLDVTFSSVYSEVAKDTKVLDESDCVIVEPPNVVATKPVTQEKAPSTGKVILKRKSYGSDSNPKDKRRKETAFLKPVSLLSPIPKRPGVTACHRLPFATGMTNRTMEFTRTTHEKNLSHSLDSAVSLTLGSLPSFRKASSGNGKTVNEIQLSSMCIVCKLDLKSIKVAAYSLPCSHKLCRDCLLLETKLSNEVICRGCLSTCPSKEIKKTHVT